MLNDTAPRFEHKLRNSGFCHEQASTKTKRKQFDSQMILKNRIYWLLARPNSFVSNTCSKWHFISMKMKNSIGLELKSKRQTMILKPNPTVFFSKFYFHLCISHFQTTIDSESSIVALLRCRASIFRDNDLYVNGIGLKTIYELMRINVEWESCWHVIPMTDLWSGCWCFLLRLMLCFDSSHACVCVCVRLNVSGVWLMCRNWNCVFAFIC